MKKTLIPMIVLAAAGVANAQIKQTWTATFNDPSTSARVAGVAVTPNNASYVLASTSTGDLRLSQYDGLGVKVWSTNLGVTADTNRPIRLITDNAGRPVLSYVTPTNDCRVIRFNEVNGAIDWSANVAGIIRIDRIAVDGQDNVVVLGYGPCTIGWGPVVVKYTNSGTVVFSRKSDGGNTDPSSLAVAANGYIYYAYTEHKTTNYVEALTPNGVKRYFSAWGNGNAAGTFCIPPVLAADRNGRMVAAEIATASLGEVRLRTFDSNGNFVQDTWNVINRTVGNIDIKFDANLKLVLATSSKMLNTTPFWGVDWFSVTDSGIVRFNAATKAVPGISMGLKELLVDHFGQAYIVGTQGTGNLQTGKVAAFDDNHGSPIWEYTDPNGLLGQPDFYGAVGRWGQVSIASTLGSPTTFEGANGIKQMGLRNLTINGASFTGGKTITGTVNFYSNDTMDRTVPLSSNTPYAVVSPTAVVTTGNSQAAMSVELKPTAVRRAVRIDGNFAGTTRSVVFYLDPPTPTYVSVYPTTVKGGNTVAATTKINGPAPSGGLTIDIASTAPAAVPPASVTIAEGGVSKTFSIATTTVSQSTATTISATANSVTKTVTLVVTP